MQNNLVMTSSPHLRDHSSTQRIMQEVCLALLPASNKLLSSRANCGVADFLLSAMTGTSPPAKASIQDIASISISAA